MSAAPQDAAPLCEVLAALGDESADLARLADRLQAVALPLIERAGLGNDHAAIEEAQRLDQLMQRLTRLAAHLHALSAASEQTWRVPPTCLASHAQDGGDFELL